MALGDPGGIQHGTSPTGGAPFLLGGDEFGNRTLGVRLPGEMLIVALAEPLRAELTRDDP